MAPSTDEDCGICLDALTNPVALPCRHKFCSNCLDSWRSKYGAQGHREQLSKTCPLCREKIPPSKEMLAQLQFWRDRVKQVEGKGDPTSRRIYAIALSEVKRMELEFGDWSEAIDYADSGGECMTLPASIGEATKRNDFQAILDWLGPPPVDKQRINAKNRHCLDNSLVTYAAIRELSDFLSVLLQYGADVNAVNAAGHTALSMIKPECTSVNLLLEWGADITTQIIEFAGSRYGNMKLANLLSSELGGRRCELLNLSARPDLNGKTCVVERYLPDKDRYKIVLEGSKESALVRPTNLKRRDRTPTDCGYYITFKKGRFFRRNFASKGECQAYVAEVEANGVAEKLAGLDISSPKGGKSGKKGKKGKKKGRK